MELVLQQLRLQLQIRIQHFETSLARESGYLLSIQQVVVLFQLHGCVVSHMQVLTTPFLSVHNVNTSFAGSLPLQAFSFSCLFREVFSHPYISFFSLLVNGFVLQFPTVTSYSLVLQSK